MRTARLPRLGVQYPRSFLKLIIVGFILVALPLILAIGNNAVSINEIADHSQRTVREAMKATEASRLLSEQLTAMERSVRQAAALEDAALLDGYRHARTRFLEGAERVAALRLGEPQRRELSDLRRHEAALSAAVESSGAAPEILIGLLDEFEELEHSATTLADLGNTVVEQEVDALQSMAAGVQRFVFWQLAALVPVALVLVVGAIILISRPISQIDAAIRRMGEGDFDERVEVSGPQDLQHLGRQLDWMRLRLIELREEKQRFLHHMSHELKTPLAAIKEGTGLLHEQLIGPLSNAQKEVTGILAQNTQRMQELIEGLLQYHETQFQRAALTPAPVPLHPLVVATLKQHSLSIVAKGLRLSVECPPLTIEADRDKLAAILGNLVSNAVKFSPRGGSLRRHRDRSGRRGAHRGAGRRTGYSGGRAREGLRAVLPGTHTARQFGEGHRARPRDRPGIRARASRQHRDRADRCRDPHRRRTAGHAAVGLQPGRRRRRDRRPEGGMTARTPGIAALARARSPASPSRR
jgi:two-component system sensor histidine kinase GlrK